MRESLAAELLLMAAEDLSDDEYETEVGDKQVSVGSTSLGNLILYVIMTIVSNNGSNSILK